MISRVLTTAFLALVLPGCGTVVKGTAKATGFAAKTATGAAWELAKFGGRTATAPLRMGSRDSGSSGGGGSYTVHGRRYHVMNPAAAARYRETGTASYYGTESGSRTANGERYSTRAMTAAHKTLPFGTRVRVTNLENGSHATFRINDRGPFVRGRIIDLTPKGADRLGFKRQGLTRVRVETR
jgi:rare lipoprotein A